MMQAGHRLRATGYRHEHHADCSRKPALSVGSRRVGGARATGERGGVGRGLCRAAENTCYFATVNYASDGSPSTSAVARPDGTLESYQPYGLEGLLVADIELEAATGLLARRCRTIE